MTDIIINKSDWQDAEFSIEADSTAGQQFMTDHFGQGAIRANCTGESYDYWMNWLEYYDLQIENNFK